MSACLHKTTTSHSRSRHKNMSAPTIDDQDALNELTNQILDVCDQDHDYLVLLNLHRLTGNARCSEVIRRIR